MRRVWGWLFVSCLMVCSVGCANCWYSYIEGWGRYGDFRQGGGADLFVPLTQGNRGLTFSQSRLYRMKRQWTAGSGVGFRLRQGDCLAWGLNGFFDYTRTDEQHNFVQLTAGGELFGPCWELRVNGYFPFDRHRRDITTDVDAFLVGTDVFANFTVFDRDATAFTGVDAQAGYGFCVRGGRLWGHARYFYYRSKGRRDLTGPHLRLYYQLENVLGRPGYRLYVGGEWQYDQVRRTQAAVAVGVRIPLGCGCPPRCYASCLCERMGDLVWRELGVTVLEREEEVDRFTEQIFSDFGNPLQVLFFDAVGGGDGTQAMPFSLDQAVAASGPQDALFGLADNGDITVNTNVALQVQQQLLGFGDEEEVVIDFGNGIEITVDDLTSSGRATLDRAVGDNIVQLENGNLVQGLRFTGADDAISGGAIVDTTARDLLIVGPQRGISLQNSAGELLFDQVQISETTDTSVVLTNLTGSFTFRDGSIVDGMGVDIRPLSATAVRNFRLDNNTIENFTQIPADGRVVALTDLSGEVAVDQNRFTNLTGPNPVDIVSVSADGQEFRLFVTGNRVEGSMTPINSSVVVEMTGITTADLAIRNNSLEEEAVTGILVQATNTPDSTIDANITRNQLFNADSAIVVATTGSNSDLNFTYDINSNRITTAVDRGVLVAQLAVGAVEPEVLQGRIRNSNMITVGTGVSVITQAGLEDDFLVSSIETNVISGATAEAIVCENQGAGAFTLSMINNADFSASVSPAFFVRNNASFVTSQETMTTCATITGNNTNRGLMDNDIQITRDDNVLAGTLDVVDLANLSANNNGISVTVDGTVSSVGMCPTP